MPLRSQGALSEPQTFFFSVLAFLAFSPQPVITGGQHHNYPYPTCILSGRWMRRPPGSKPTPGGLGALSNVLISLASGFPPAGWGSRNPPHIHSLRNIFDPYLVASWESQLSRGKHLVTHRTLQIHSCALGRSGFLHFLPG